MSSDRVFSFGVSCGRIIIMLCFLAGMALAPVPPASAAAGTIRFVSPGGIDTANDCQNSSNPCKTVAHALSVAVSDDFIYLDPGVYFEHDLLIDKDQFTLQKNPSKICPVNSGYLYVPCPTIDGGAAGRVLHVTGQNVSVQDIIITGGKLTDDPGGGILNEGQLTLDHVTLTGNVLDALSADDANRFLSSGGGINNQGRLYINNSSIHHNSAINGAGIYSTGVLTITASRVYSNTAMDNGGGLEDATCSFLKIDSASFWDNQAQEGGGIFIYDDSHPENCDSITLTNVTISENRAVHVYGGPWGVGGLRSAARVQFDHTTIYNNHSSAGSPVDSLLLDEYQLTLNPPGLPSTFKNTLIAHTSGSALLCNIARTMLLLGPGGHNLSSDHSCGFYYPEDFQDTDPQLLPLGDNGGPVETCALSGRSPAIDHGLNSTTVQDARGISYQDGDLDGVVTPDIGAYEFVPLTIDLPLVIRQ
jgi:hypothetical protein